MSTNENKKNNVRDLTYAFVIVFFIYGFIGTCGSLGLVGMTPITPNPSTIYDYFPAGNVLIFVV